MLGYWDVDWSSVILQLTVHTASSNSERLVDIPYLAINNLNFACRKVQISIAFLDKELKVGIFGHWLRLCSSAADGFFYLEIYKLLQYFYWGDDKWQATTHKQITSITAAPSKINGKAGFLLIPIQSRKKDTAPGIPRRSPIQVLTRPAVA